MLHSFPNRWKRAPLSHISAQTFQTDYIISTDFSPNVGNKGANDVRCWKNNFFVVLKNVNNTTRGILCRGVSHIYAEHNKGYFMSWGITHLHRKQQGVFYVVGYHTITHKTSLSTLPRSQFPCPHVCLSGSVCVFVPVFVWVCVRFCLLVCLPMCVYCVCVYCVCLFVFVPILLEYTAAITLRRYLSSTEFFSQTRRHFCPFEIFRCKVWGTRQQELYIVVLKDLCICAVPLAVHRYNTLFFFEELFSKNIEAQIWCEFFQEYEIW